MNFTPVSDQYLYDNRHNDLCAICLLNRWGLAPPKRKNMATDREDATYMGVIRPALEALRTGLTRIDNKRKQVVRIIHDYNLGAKPEKTKKPAKVA